MSEPRVLHLLTRDAGGGTETNVHRLCERTPSFEALSLESMMGFPLRWTRLPAAVRSMRSRRPDVVFCYGLSAHLAAVAAWPWGKPLVGSMRGLVDFEGRKGAIRSLIGWRFREWISNSRAVLRGKGGTVIYNGIDEPPGGEEPMLGELPRPVFGVLASGNPVKGHDWLLALWKRLGKPGSLVFAGNLGAELHRRATAEGVHCPGHVKAGPLLRSLDMLLVPSRSESLPTVLLEAMIRGVPCLATPVGGIPELLVHGNNGYMLAPEEWEEFLRRIDWEEARRLGEEGRRTVQRDFTFGRMQQQFLEVARRAAG